MAIGNGSNKLGGRILKYRSKSLTSGTHAYCTIYNPSYILEQDMFKNADFTFALNRILIES